MICIDAISLVAQLRDDERRFRVYATAISPPLELHIDGELIRDHGRWRGWVLGAAEYAASLARQVEMVIEANQECKHAEPGKSGSNGHLK